MEIVSFEIARWCGASVKYTMPGDDGQEEFSAKFARPLHPDLRSIFEDGLAPKVRFLLGFPKDAEFVMPSGVAFPKDGVIQYTAIIRGPKGEYTAKTPKVLINNLEDEPLIESLKTEIEAYINGKTSQLSIFGE